MLIAAAMVLGASVFREDVAQAAEKILLVREQNVDANGNIKVHEQGIVNVNVTDTSSLALEMRVTLIAENLVVSTLHSATSDCKRNLIAEHWGLPGGPVFKFNVNTYLQTSSDGTQADATYLHRAITANDPSNITWEFVHENRPVVAPFARLHLSNFDRAQTLIKAWLRCNTALVNG